MHLIGQLPGLVMIVLLPCVLKENERAMLEAIAKQHSNDACLNSRREVEYKFSGEMSNIARTLRQESVVHKFQSTKSLEQSQGNQTRGNHTSYLDDAANSSLPSEDIQFNSKARTDGYTLGKPEDTPYSVLLNMHTSGDLLLGGCTGSLVTLEWVLTAAHCLHIEHVTVGYVKVYAGGNSEAELVDNQLAPGSQLRKSVEHYPHPRYGKYLIDYDVGVIKVDPPFDTSTTVQTITLSKEKWPYHSYQLCLLAGFGRVQFGEKHKDDGKRKEHRLMMKVPCLCQWRYKQIMGKTSASKLVCSKPLEDYGVCSGDSGGGVVCGGELRAVVSSMMRINPKNLCDIELFADNVCGTQYSMNLFSNTCPFIRWINEHVKLYDEASIDDACFDWKVSRAHRSAPPYWVFLVCLINKIIHSI